MKRYLWLIAILLLACESDDVEQTPRILVVLSVDSNNIRQDERLFYSVKGESGEDISFGELMNSEQLVVTDDSYTGEKIALTLFRHFLNNNIVIVNSYLDLSPGESVILDNFVTPRPIPETTGNYKFVNLPSSFDLFLMSSPGIRQEGVGGQLVDGDVISFPTGEDFPISLFSFFPNQGIPQYQEVRLSPTEETTIDIEQNINMENTYFIESSLNNLVDFDIQFTLKANLEGQSTSLIGYSVYNSNRITPNVNGFNVYSPSLFNSFVATIDVRQDDLLYRQATIGDMPDRFDFIDTDINVTNNSFNNFNFSVVNSSEISSIEARWSAFDNGVAISWEVHGKETLLNDFELEDIPELISSQISPLSILSSLEPQDIQVFKNQDVIYPDDQDIFGFDPVSIPTSMVKTLQF
ncbi:MAG: hypothetical protein AAFN93_07180 [Bacteroidota bacterium]